MSNGFLPISKEDMEREHITQLDFVYVIGDAYVDHPSFGHAIISRSLQLHGYTVGIISQPDWRDKDSISILGEPRLGFLVTAGNMDSMVNHYSVSKHRRNMDSFTPGGVMGKRPDYATIVYCNLIRQTYKHTPILIGGIECITINCIISIRYFPVGVRYCNSIICKQVNIKSKKISSIFILFYNVVYSFIVRTCNN